MNVVEGIVIISTSCAIILVLIIEIYYKLRKENQISSAVSFNVTFGGLGFCAPARVMKRLVATTADESSKKGRTAVFLFIISSFLRLLLTAGLLWFSET